MDTPNFEQLNFAEGKNLRLVIEAWSNAARTVQVSGISKNSIISGGLVTNADRSVATANVRIGEFPIFLAVRTTATSVRRGELYVRVSLQAAETRIAVLAAGYVTDERGLSFPNGKIESSVEGPGLIRSILGTDPAAGVEISETVPTNARWRLLAIRFTFVTDATAATRAVTLVMTHGASNEINAHNGGTQTASVTQNYNFANGYPLNTLGTSGMSLAVLPTRLLLPQAGTITTVTTALQAGDNFSAPSLLVEEWIEE